MVRFPSPLRVWVVVVVVVMVAEGAPKRHYDKTIKRYTNEKTCWWNEICKEEFQQEFRCKCPRFSYCRSPGPLLQCLLFRNGIRLRVDSTEVPRASPGATTTTAR
ncbi:hypothetical protein O3P69_019579 [Scylla paramamosain]|uniref:Secreted protein n=1 Tax=Scylla paramamosain TaxID=85552 RepID=A0AAW0SXH7_SCYPA